MLSSLPGKERFRQVFAKSYAFGNELNSLILLGSWLGFLHCLEVGVLQQGPATCFLPLQRKGMCFCRWMSPAFSCCLQRVSGRAEQSCRGARWGPTFCFVPWGPFRWSVVRGCDPAWSLLFQHTVHWDFETEFLGLKLYAAIVKIHL